MPAGDRFADNDPFNNRCFTNFIIVAAGMVVDIVAYKVHGPVDDDLTRMVRKLIKPRRRNDLISIIVTVVINAFMIVVMTIAMPDAPVPLRKRMDYSP
jgi:hypothetical protein